jgi:predicted nucleic acid-binding protein
MIEDEPPMRSLSSLLLAIGRREVVMVASTALLAEVLPAHPSRPRSAEARRKTRDMLRASETDLIDVNTLVADKAAEYRMRYRMKTWDAVHLATAVLGRCDVIFVNDDDFPIDEEVDGVWVSRPYDIEGEHLLNLNPASGNPPEPGASA